MMSYKELSDADQEKLKLYPAYESLLAATYHSHGLDSKEKQTAIEFIHVKTFKHIPALAGFYTEAEKDFEKNLTLLNTQLPKDKKEREARIHEEIAKLDRIVDKLEPDDAATFRKSMDGFREHVANAHQSMLEYFVFPIPIKGLTY